MQNISYRDVIQHLLDLVPEIRSDYEKELAWVRGIDIPDHVQEEFDTITEKYDLPEGDEVGPTIVFENILVPFVISLVDESNNERLHEIMLWLEKLARNEDFHVRNLVVGSVCIPLLTTYETKIGYIYPYMGESIRKMCKTAIPSYRVSANTRQLFA